MNAMSLNSANQSNRLHVVTREDRLSEFTGLKLLLASMQRKCPSVRISAYLMSEHIDVEGENLRSIHPDLRLVAMDEVNGWACKPSVLLDALSRESDEDAMVLWIDTDIIVLRDISELIETPHESVVSAEEANPNPNLYLKQRQELLGLDVGPPRQSTISSAVIGVRRRHQKILETWQRGVESSEFKSEQQLPLHSRLLYGDQEVWEAVLCTPEFRCIEVRLLRNFNEMLQATYTSYVQSSQMKRQVEPLFVHATGNLKPWRASRLRFTQEIFPYFDEAQLYLASLAPEQVNKFFYSSILAKLFKLVSGFSIYTHLRRLHHRIMN